MEGVELHVALREADCLQGARLSRVHQLGRILFLRTFGPSGALALDPGGKAFHPTGLRPPTPDDPPPFCLLVRKLCGQPLIALEQAGYDRVIRLRFPEADLVLDLRPRQGEVFLHWHSGDIHALGGGVPRPAAFDEPGEISEGVGPELKRAAKAEGIAPEELAQQALERSPAGFLYETPRGLLASFFPRKDLGHPVETMDAFWKALDRVLERRLTDPAAQWLRERLRSAAQRRRRALVRLQEGKEEAERWPKVQAQADLILARLSDIPHGEPEVEVEGFDGQPAKLDLDPKVPPVAHAQALYRRARKMRRRLEHLPRRGRQLELELDKLEELARTLDDRPELAPYLEEELARLGEQQRAGRRRRSPKRGQGREIHLEGFPVRIGRSARENDALIKRAREHDLWLHAKGVPGAHVVIATGGNPVPQGVVQRAAELAAWHSQARGEAKVQVSYTEARNLRKPKGGSPGAVRLLSERVLTVPGDRGP